MNSSKDSFLTWERSHFLSQAGETGRLRVLFAPKTMDRRRIRITASSNRRRSRVPPAMSLLDFQVFLPSTVPSYHLDTPNRTFDCYLWVHSRTSAVLTTFFSKAEFLRGYLSTLFVIVAILFLLVELVAVIIGISLSRRLTGAVHQLYEGTRRVLLGDFHHRIPVRAGDQLGELGQSFNQMTSNLERLFAVEKEKERLQTELEIAREVQYQLYPTKRCSDSRFAPHRAVRSSAYGFGRLL